MKAKSDQKLQVNLNDFITCKLTDHGEQILKDNSTEYDISWRYNKETKVLYTELWSFMNIFGEHIYNGCKQIIVDNTLTFNK